mmetsp:Transcript_14987/g.32502  ORF Transcript_14987/g.32502 Transcript_14987/m.32502 type:complete len:256 (+) Transcript_14987:13-780(+)|eukprot:CAMPEP_0172326940 /NCGR_PEP_ID=MMETSP1058-20130122/58066_1 /TAXON_ID=83371 /ORGANISM="Detonula confervacea, Strain CCMP 353" /LENGTH=255 /DNA_ID=CAMNT_0013043847 /DNA_START=7 /DNA_END=774 /DNA_ORIENTATION=+
MSGHGSDRDDDQMIHNDEPQTSISSGAQKQQAPKNVVMTIRIAPPSASELNDRRAVRCRTRHERPQKLRIAEQKDQDGDGATDAQLNAYEPDIESFVSGCIPGVSFVTGTSDESMQSLSQRRAKLIRKRSLPLMSFLSSTHLAAAEKKRRNEEHERQKAIGEEAAAKALLLNPIKPTTLESETLNAETKSEQNIGSREGGVGLEKDIREAAAVEGNSTPQVETPTVTTTMEKTSNILMPPLLKDFLNQLEKSLVK